MSSEQLGIEAVEVEPSGDQSGFPEDLPEDFSQAIQQLASEKGVELNDDGQIADSEMVAEPTPEPAQPVAEEESAQAVATPAEEVEVPEKFQKEDGTVDVSKVEQATEAAEEAIKALSPEEALLKYKGLEKELGKAQNQANQQQPTPTEPVQPLMAQPENLDSVAKQIEDEIKLNGTGVALAKLMNAISESTYQRSQADLSGLQGEITGNREAKELKRIAETDSWALTETGFNALSEHRRNNPHLEGAKSPWQATLNDYKGQGLAPSTTQSGQGVPTPKPKGQIVTPSSGARTVQPITKSPLDGLSGDALNKALDKLSVKDQDAFWKSKGFPGWNNY